MADAFMRTLAVLGSTGSIGTNTLDVVRRNRHLYEVHSLVAGYNIEVLTAQILEFRPKLAVVADPAGLDRLKAALESSGLDRAHWPQLGCGAPARVDAVRASEVDTVISAIVGVAGLEATYEAICLGKRIGLANKEVLVSGGSLVMEAARRHGVELLPVDSEHNGAHQCLRAGNRARFRS
jgi:1-deoxy-D-xylulose-5-phosphate reductoisomerase